MQNEVTKNEAGSVALAVFDADLAQIWEVMQANQGPGGLTEMDFTKIKVPAGGAIQWAVQTLQGEVQTAAFDCLQLMWHDRNQFYKTKYGQGEGNKPPDCSSKDGLIGIGDPGGKCADCPLGEHGSGDDNAKACRQYRSLYVLRADNILPEILAVPPTSIKAHRQYQMKLTSNKIPCYGVVTRISLNRTKNSKGTVYSEVVFNVVRKLTPEETATVARYRAMFEHLAPSYGEANDAMF